MGTFTIRLSEVIESGEPVFLDDPASRYPIFNEEYRDSLNKKIVEHYMNYEIGHETVSMFRYALNRKMREIMPLYNQLYKSTLIEIDPLATVNYNDDVSTENSAKVDSTGKGTLTGNTGGTMHSESAGTQASTTDSKSRSVASETPQTHLSGNEDYATSATDSVGNTSVSGDSGNTVDQTTSGTESQTSDNAGTQTSAGNGSVSRNVKGSQGHQATLLMQYRKSLLNIDMDVISELESLFMAVWDNGDEFTGSNGGVFYGSAYGWFGSL